MIDPDRDTLDSAPAQPEYLWLVGYEHLLDSMRRDTNDSTADRERAAQTAAMMFAASQARSLAVIATHAPALLEQQRIANALNATGRMGVLNSDDELGPARRAARRLLGLDDQDGGAR